jgi:hypothetical protein
MTTTNIAARSVIWASAQSSPAAAHRTAPGLGVYRWVVEATIALL